MTLFITLTSFFVSSQENSINYPSKIFTFLGMIATFLGKIYQNVLFFPGRVKFLPWGFKMTLFITLTSFFASSQGNWIVYLSTIFTFLGMIATFPGKIYQNVFQNFFLSKSMTCECSPSSLPGQSCTLVT